MSWKSPATGYGSGISEYDAARLNKLRSILGDRYEISWARMDRTGYHAEIVEGDRETVYNVDGDTIELLCGLALREIFNDVNAGGLRERRTVKETVPLDEPHLAISGFKASTDEFEAQMKAVEKTLTTIKKAFERTMK